MAQHLTHVDLSGLNLGKDELKELCPVLASCDVLQCVHLSDNGIIDDPDFLEEVQEMFGVPETAFVSLPGIANKPLEKAGELRALIRKQLLFVKSAEVLDDKKGVSTAEYKNHYVMAKQSKAINEHKLLNQAQLQNGIGHTHTNLFDQVLFTRRVNRPELAFNQLSYIDAYFS